jgi:hypothetical protein
MAYDSAMANERYATHRRRARRSEQPARNTNGQSRTTNGQNGHRSLADLPPDEVIGVLRLLDSESQAREVAMLVPKTYTSLQSAVNAKDLAGIAACRVKAASILKIAQQLKPPGLRDDAMELMRRIERKLGVAIREEHRYKRNPEAKSTDFATKGELWGDDGNGIFGMTDGITDAQFDQALAQARAEGNLTRTRIIRNCHPKPQSFEQQNTSHIEQCLVELTNAIPKSYQMLVLLTAWCAIDFQQLKELRRRDIDMSDGVIRIRRGMRRHQGGEVVVTLTDRGRVRARDVEIPPDLLPALKDHLCNHVDPDIDALVFPGVQGGYSSLSVVHNYFYAAASIIGQPGLRFKDLRELGLASADDMPTLLTKLKTAPPPPPKIRKTAAARKVMETLAIKINSLVFIVDDTDPMEVDAKNHQEDIKDVMQGMAKIGRFLNKVKEQDI